MTLSLLASALACRFRSEVEIAAMKLKQKGKTGSSI